MVEVIKDDDGIVVAIKMTVFSEPVAQGRPRFSTHGKYVKAYDPQKSRDYKRLLREMAQEVYKEQPDFKPFEVPLGLRVTAYRSVPKSFSKKKHEEAVGKKIHPVTKPDVSNYIKGIEDGLNGVLWKDDSFIISEFCMKAYSDQPRIELVVWSLV